MESKTVSSGKQTACEFVKQTLNNSYLNTEIPATAIQHSGQLLSTSLGEKRCSEVCMPSMLVQGLGLAKGKKSYCQEPALGKHTSRSHLLIFQLKCHCRNRAGLSRVSLCSTNGLIPLYTELSLWVLLGLIPLPCTD